MGLVETPACDKMVTCSIRMLPFWLKLVDHFFAHPPQTLNWSTFVHFARGGAQVKATIIQDILLIRWCACTNFLRKSSQQIQHRFKRMRACLLVTSESEHDTIVWMDLRLDVTSRRTAAF